MHDPGTEVAPEVPIRFFDKEKTLVKVPRCQIKQFHIMEDESKYFSR